MAQNAPSRDVGNRDDGSSFSPRRLLATDRRRGGENNLRWTRFLLFYLVRKIANARGEANIVLTQRAAALNATFSGNFKFSVLSVQIVSHG